ncbi:MAG: glutamyl-tRNA reductase [Phycisphaerae bacterium]
MRILCTGLNHKTAELSLRERLAFDDHAATRALVELVETWPEAQFLLLSTCNRVEIYVIREVHGHPREQQLHLWLARNRGLGLESFSSSLYTLVDADAMEHLFAVAAGLDSLVPGEHQIVGQLKSAARRSIEANASGGLLGDLVDTALRAAKQVRNNTPIGHGRVSAASVGLDALAGRFRQLAGKCVLSIGAGKMNRILLQGLAERQAGPIYVANRSADKARQLAAACGGQVRSFGQIPAALAEADVVVCSTASETPILSARAIRRAMESRPDRPLVILDLAVPRDVEPAAGEIRSVELVNIDDLQQVVRANLKIRDAGRDEAYHLLRGHVLQLRERFQVRSVAPTIKALYQKMRQITDQELAEAANKLADHDDIEQDLDILRRTLHRTIRRMLHPAAVQLRSEAGSDIARVHAAALERLFQLNQQDPPTPDNSAD